MDAREGLPTDEDFEFAERDGDLGFVVGVGVFLGVLGVELCGEVFVWVDLEGECFGYGEDLGR